MPTGRRNSRAATAWCSATASARRWRWHWSTARCAISSSARSASAPAQWQEFVLPHGDSVEASGFVQHLKLPHYVTFESELQLLRAAAARRASAEADAAAATTSPISTKRTKRMIRRALLKAVACPATRCRSARARCRWPTAGAPAASRSPRPSSAPSDVLKVIDQGADDTTNAVNIRQFFARTAGVATTTRTRDATVIQTRHRIPEAPLSARADPGLPGAAARAAVPAGGAPRRDGEAARVRRLRPDERQAVRGHRRAGAASTPPTTTRCESTAAT